jgi:murein DD-endopeptidase MepM/ murein hydrolase activator NlpD
MSRKRLATGLAAFAAVAIASGIFAIALAVSRASDRLTAPDPSPPPGAVAEGDPVETRAAALDSPPPVAPPPPAALPEIGAEDALEELTGRRLSIPVAGVAAGDLVDTFRELRGASRPHEAIDILAPRHTPVVAVEDGTIARLFLSDAGGTTVYQFDPSSRFVYYYAHLEGYARGLSEKDRVRRDQVIGYVGTSGNAPRDTPHLHFAIFRLTEERRWWEGTPVDPFAILTGKRPGG